MKNNGKILLGLSGGVDSEYSAKLLLNLGYEVFGLYVNMLNKDTSKVEKTAEKLSVPLFIIDKSSEFISFVTEPFLKCYKEGKTPNPCVECNRFVKIQTLIEESERLDIPYVATGHYAKISENEGRYSVSRASDLKKDQSYFLWKLTQKQLKKLVFPLGDVLKENILSAETEKGYKESQDICFIDGDYRDFLKVQGVKTLSGNFLNTKGEIVGIHSGIQNYTRGQRKGLGIALGYPAFVTDIDPIKNTVTLGNRDELKVNSFFAENLNFQSTEEFHDERVYYVKTRYRAIPQKASVKLIDNKAKVELFEADTLVTPGQSAVFYDGDNVAFGGEIVKEGMK